MSEKNAPTTAQQELQPGDIVPDFTLPGTDGATTTLSALRGKPVVIFVYPQDDTPSCTTENRDFSALAADFAAIDVALLGLSRDKMAKHDRFRTKHGLAQTLLSDADGTATETLGLWVEKKMYGRTYMGLERATLLIGADGRLVQIWRRVRVKGHAAEVLAAARALQNPQS